MNEERIPILFNKNAGAAKGKIARRDLERMATHLGLRVTIIPTTSNAELKEKVAEFIKKKAPKLVVAGGDGTISVAVQQLAYTDTILGIIPLGTANNFATALRLPQDLPSALRVLKYGRTQRVSLGKVNKYYFTESAGMGLFADVLALYGSGPHKSALRAVYALFRILFRQHAKEVAITIDGVRLTKRLSMCSVHNAYRMSMAVPLAPDARLTDDTLEVVMIEDLTLRELLQYYRAVRTQLHISLPKVTTIKGKEVKIAGDGQFNVHCDDRVIGTTPVTISSHPRALRVLVDRL